ncbi:MAG: LuxR C-terminal-related transcriptional regulator [Deltaproteobacteria bacterium]|nr:LuxR C-terminal-related transcriptional regulator [Deltaproteobacteria bacterium]
MSIPPGPKSFDFDQLLQAQYQQLLARAQQEASPDGILVVDHNNRVKSWNRRFLELWGIDPRLMKGADTQRLLGLVLPQLADPREFTKRLEHLYRHLEEAEDAWEFALGDGRVLVRYSRGLLSSDGGYWGRVWFYRDVSRRVRMERELRAHRDHLAEEVAQATHGLKEEIARRQKTERQLRDKEESLKAQARHLEETNIALKVLLNQSAEDRRSLTSGFRANLETVVLPYLEELASGGLSREQQALVRVITDNLEALVSPFVSKLMEAHPDLTPREVQVADLVRAGKTNKEIAPLLGISARAVEFHRENLRRKLGIAGQRANLRARLLSLK